jgi:hypothetical protein
MRRREGVTTAPPPEIQSLTDPALVKLFRDIYDHLFTEQEPSTTVEQVSQTAAGFVDRGDPAAADWTEADLSLSTSNWADLDLSSIVPAGATLVALRVLVATTASAAGLQFREKGNSNDYNVDQVDVVLNQQNFGTVFVVPSSARVVQYRAVASTTLTAQITVGGWWA